MGMGRDGPNRGAVVTCILSPTRIVLVLDEQGSFDSPRWKLPGGSLEGKERIVSAAIRECLEETGIRLLSREILLHSWHWRGKEGYRPHLCIAQVTEEKLDTRLAVGQETNGPLLVKAFKRTQVLGMPDLLDKHRALIEEVFEFLT